MNKVQKNSNKNATQQSNIKTEMKKSAHGMPNAEGQKSVIKRTYNGHDVGTHPHMRAAHHGRRIVSWFLFALLFLSLFLLAKLAWPFLDTIILACIFSAIAYPLTKFFLRLTKGKNITSAMLTILVLLIMVALPLTFFIMELIPQAGTSIAALTQWLSDTHLDTSFREYISPPLAWLKETLPFVDITPDQIRTNLLSFASRTGQMLLTWGTNLLGDTLHFAISTLLMLLIMFFLLKEGPEMVRALKRLCPMREDQMDHILDGLGKMSKAVLVGGLSVAALQGLIGGIGLALVGIPAIFWGTLMAFAALVPVVGTGLIWIPAAIYLAMIGRWQAALFLLFWCVIFVSAIDSFLRPMLMRGSSNISILFVFMSVFGGIQVFGMLGLLYGPLILSFALVMLHIYAEEYKETLYENG